MSRGKKQEEEEELLTHLSQPLRLEVLHSHQGPLRPGEQAGDGVNPQQQLQPGVELLLLE